MIIQCEKCQTRFRLDDSRVTDKGVKVRCTKCKQVFTVQKGEPDTESGGAELAAAGSFSAGTQDVTPDATQGEQDDAAASFPDVPREPGAGEEPADFSTFEASLFDASPTPFESDLLASAATGTAAPGMDEPFDFSSLDTPSFEASAPPLESDEFPDAGTDTHEPVDMGSDDDFARSDFAGFDSGPDVSELLAAGDDNYSAPSFNSEEAQPQGEAPAPDFSDDIFGPVVPPSPEPHGDTFAFDTGNDSFADLTGSNEQDSSTTRSTLFSLDVPLDAPGGAEKVDSDEFSADSGAQETPEIALPLETGDVPLAQPVATPPLAPEHVAVDQQEELPPLSITSRRKQSPLFSGLIAVIAVLAISVFGYFGYSSFITSKDVAVPEEGKIGVRAVKAAFIKNDAAGELLVVSGEALNEYPKPRAALQVKVTVFDAAGNSIATKIAYGGNPQTAEQLKSLPLDKIEAAMANQFGDSLANMEVASGKAIPFVVVLANLPAGARNFAVQSAGSTVAAGKAQ